VPRPLSVDLRTRIVNACAAQEWAPSEIADRFQVHLKTVEKLWKQWRTTHSVAPKPYAGGRKPRWAPYDQDLRTWLAEPSDDTHQELIALLSQRQPITVSPSMMSRALARLGLPRKKKSLSASERQRPEGAEAREAFRPVLATRRAEDLVFVEESGVTTKLTRLDGRAPKGQRVPEAVPHGRWEVTTILGALGTTGRQAGMTVETSTDADVFEVFVEQVLGPTWRAGQVVVMDNLSAHKPERVRERIEARGCQLPYWPPDSPDLNPIEPAWSKGKTHWRALKARTQEALEAGGSAALKTITAPDAHGYCGHCGYALQ
jgi:transposase